MSEVGKLANVVVQPIKVMAGGQIVGRSGGSNGDPSEREDVDIDGLSTKGFASSVVPTLEEKTIFERRPHSKHTNGQPLFDLIEENGIQEDGSEPSEAEVPSSAKEDPHIVDNSDNAREAGAPMIQGEPGDKELYGAPANAVENDDQLPTRDTKRSDSSASEQERQAVEARKTLRKHLAAKVGNNAWNMPTPTPIVNPNMFHDPLDDRFWKDQWVAVAVHNVSVL